MIIYWGSLCILLGRTIYLEEVYRHVEIKKMNNNIKASKALFMFILLLKYINLEYKYDDLSIFNIKKSIIYEYKNIN